MTFKDETDSFLRLHRMFTAHLGIAVSLAWLTSLFAAVHAPWVRDIRFLIDPLAQSRPESTWSFLFALPVVLTLAWLMSVFGREALRSMRMLKSETIEFLIAGAVAFALFYMSIDRSVTAYLLGA